jgi:hypothetical protein
VVLVVEVVVGVPMVIVVLVLVEFVMVGDV